MKISLKNVIESSEVQYNKGEDTYLTDAEYDYLAERGYLDDEPILDHVPILDNTRFVTSPFWMGSVETFFEGTGNLDKWLNIIRDEVIYLTPKLDGASVMYWNDEGMMKMANRGRRQNKCQNISDMLGYMELPYLPEGVVCRGELVTTKTFFNKMQEQYGYICHRNMISGIMRHFATDGYIESKYMDMTLNIFLVVFEVFVDNRVYGVHNLPGYVKPMLIGEQIELVQPKPIDRPEVTEEYLSDIQYEYKKDCIYPVDGIVMYIASDNTPNTKSCPVYCKAYKDALNVDSATVVVKEIKWGVGVTGQLTPTLHFDPVFLCDANISSVTAHNAKNMLINEMGIGTEVTIIRSGEVIPKIVDINNATGFVMPDKDCYWDEYGTHLVSRIRGRDKIVAELHHFVKEIGAKGVGVSSLEAFYSVGCCSIADLFEIGAEDISFLGPNKPEKLVNILHSALQSASLVDIMEGSKVFPKGIGRERLQSIVRNFPHLRPSESNIRALYNFSDKTTASTMKGIKLFRDFLKTSSFIERRVDKLINTAYEDSVNDLSDHTDSDVVTFTGFRDQSLVDLLESNGMKYKRSMTNKTTILVTATQETDNKTVLRAEKMEVVIINKEEFVVFLREEEDTLYE